MFKKRFLLLCMLLFFAMLCSCNNSSSGGDVSNVVQTADSSDIYTTEEIESAMNVVKDYFKDTEEFQDCTLTKLYYDEAVSSGESAGWAEQYAAEEAIVLLSSFDVGSENKHSGLDQNRTYDNFKWILVRSAQGNWTLETWGY